MTVLFGQPLREVGPLRAHLRGKSESKSQRSRGITTCKPRGSAKNATAPAPTGAVAVAHGERRAAGASHARARCGSSLGSFRSCQAFSSRRRIDAVFEKIRIPSTTTAVVMADPTQLSPQESQQACNDDVPEERGHEHAVSEASFQPCAPAPKSASGRQRPRREGTGPRRHCRARHEQCDDQSMTAIIECSPSGCVSAVVRTAKRSAPALPCAATGRPSSSRSSHSPIGRRTGSHRWRRGRAQRTRVRIPDRRDLVGRGRTG